MSRIGRKPIAVPNDVQVELGANVVVNGPLGQLSYKLPIGIKVEKAGQDLLVKRSSEEKQIKALHGLARSLLANMVEGVKTGFKKQLELSGIGYRASMVQDKLTLNIGYSHPVEVVPPEGVSFAVAENKITVSGISKELVGKVASEIRLIRKPNVYKGKGIRYSGERVKLKPGKAAKAGVGAKA
jgi:large subunit ribosomal protein L6